MVTPDLHRKLLWYFADKFLAVWLKEAPGTEVSSVPCKKILRQDAVQNLYSDKLNVPIKRVVVLVEMFNDLYINEYFIQ